MRSQAKWAVAVTTLIGVVLALPGCVGTEDSDSDSSSGSGTGSGDPPELQGDSGEG